MRMLAIRNTVKSLLIVIILAAFSLPQPSYSQQDISEYEKRLRKIAEQMKDIRKKINKEDKKKSSILSRLAKIGFSKDLIRKEISFYSTQLKKANEELTPIKERIPQLKVRLKKEKESIEEILVTMYKFGRLSYIEVLLQVEDIGDLISESKNLILLAQYQENIIDNYMGTLDELRTTEESLEEKKKEIVNLIQKNEKKRQELVAQERKSKALVREIEKNKETHTKMLEELNDRAEQLQILIKKLLKEEISFPAPLVPLYEKKGKLPWPISGKLVTLFGLRRHPQFRTITMNNGIEISPQKNMIVKSIHPGTVVYTDYFQGYGNLIIIDHGMTYYSLYGHCSEFLANKGDFVKAEQPIAIVGDISSLKGTTLYLEIRYKTKPLNPLQWLKRR